MKQCADNRDRNSKERAKCNGFSNKLRQWHFVAELLLLADVLDVLWNLSAYFQRRDASLVTANPKIRVAINTLRALKNQPGINLSLLITADKHCTVFQDIDLTAASHKDFEVRVFNKCFQQK